MIKQGYALFMLLGWSCSILTLNADDSADAVVWPLLGTRTFQGVEYMSRFSRSWLRNTPKWNLGMKSFSQNLSNNLMRVNEKLLTEFKNIESWEPVEMSFASPQSDESSYCKVTYRAVDSKVSFNDDNKITLLVFSDGKIADLVWTSSKVINKDKSRLSDVSPSIIKTNASTIVTNDLTSQYVLLFRFRGQYCGFRVPSSIWTNQLSWYPEKQPPCISPEECTEIAQQWVSKQFKDFGRFQLNNVMLCRWRNTNKWYYIVACSYRTENEVARLWVAVLMDKRIPEFIRGVDLFNSCSPVIAVDSKE